MATRVVQVNKYIQDNHLPLSAALSKFITIPLFFPLLYIYQELLIQASQHSGWFLVLFLYNSE